MLGVRMGATVEWYQSNQSTAYPFKERQSDNMHLLFTDAAVYHNRELDRAYDLRLHACSLVSPAAADLRFSDGTQLTYLLEGGAGVTFQKIVFGEYTIYEWRRSTVNGSGFTDEDIIVRLVVVTARMADFPGSFNLVDGTLIPSLVNPRIKRVRRLFVKRALTGDIDLVTHDKVRFEAGSNLEFAVEDTPAAKTVRVPTTIKINAAPGLGAGVVLECNEIEGIKTINKVGPDERGNFNLSSSPCSWFERPMKNPGPPTHPHTDGTLQPADAQWPYNAPVVTGPGLILHQDCKACCSCDDYVNAYRAMLGVWQRAQALAARAQALQSSYNALCSLMNAGGGKHPTGLQCRIDFISRPNFTVGISVTVYNNSPMEIPQSDNGGMGVYGYIQIDKPSSYITVLSGSGRTESSRFNGNYYPGDPSSPVAVPPDSSKFEFIIGAMKTGGWWRRTWVMRFNETMTERANVAFTLTASFMGGGMTAEDIRRPTLRPPLELQ